MKLKDDNDVMKREDEMSFSDIAKIDRRITPRLEGNIYLLVEKQKGIVVNFNETGIAFLLNEPLKKDRFQGKFKVNPQTVSLDMEVIWKRKREGEKYFYGAKYTEINPGKIEKLRKEFILKKISTIMRTIDGLKNRKEIVKISREIAKYIVEVYLLSEKIDCCNVETKTADKILSDSTEKMMKKAEIFETKIKNKLLIKKTKNEFRKLVSPWAYKGYIVKRSFDKPRGYPGDYRIMEYIYDETLMSKGIGRSFDVFFQRNQYAESVRKRKDWMRVYLKKFIREKCKKKISMLNIACGSNREIREIMRDKEYIFNSKLADKNINFKLLDQDVEALNFSMSDLKRFKHIANFEAFDNTVMDIITKDMIAQELSNMDLIYTIGLADYLPDRVLGRLLEKCFRTYLAKGGHLVIAHKDISKYNPLPPNWFCDWNFYSRTQKDIEQLLSAYIDQKLAITKYYRDETGVIFFADIKKKK